MYGQETAGKRDDLVKGRAAPWEARPCDASFWEGNGSHGMNSGNSFRVFAGFVNLSKREAV